MRIAPVVINELSYGGNLLQVEPTYIVSPFSYRYLPLTWLFSELTKHLEMQESYEKSRSMRLWTMDEERLTRVAGPVVTSGWGLVDAAFHGQPFDNFDLRRLSFSVSFLLAFCSSEVC